jgi:hypothetical protein
MKTKNLIPVIIALTGILFLSAFSEDYNAADPMAAIDQTIAEYASGDADFSILVQARQEVDLSAETLCGPIEISLIPSPSINGTIMIVATDVQETNGIVHVIDKVLLPEAG